MPDQDAKIRLTVEDNTAPALKSAAANIKKVTDQLAKAYAPATKAGADWARAAESSAKRLGTSLDDVARRQVEFGRKTKDNAKNFEELGGKGGAAISFLTRNLEGGTAALAAMAGRYLGVAAAAEVARKSFLGFAATDQRMRLLQNDAGATRKQIDATTESLKKLSVETATAMDPLIEGFNELRESGQLSLEETEKIFPKIAKAAKGSGMDVVALGRSMGDMMRNMKVPAEGVDSALEAITFGVQDLRMNADALTKVAPKLTESMAEWGYTGRAGVNSMVAFMGSLQKVTGDTTKSGMVLSRLLETMSSGEMSTALGFETASGLQKHLRAAQEAGEDVLGVYIGLIAKSKDRDAVLNKIGLKERAAVRALLADYEEMNKRVNDIANSQGRAAGAFKNVMDGPQASIDKMLISLDLLSKEFGALLHQLGTTTAITWLTDQIRQLISEVKLLKELWMWIKGEGEFPKDAGSVVKKRADMALGTGQAVTGVLKHIPLVGPIAGGINQGLGAARQFTGTPEDLKAKNEEDAASALRRLGMKRLEEEKAVQRFNELNKELDGVNKNIKKMSFQLDKSDDKVKVWNAALDQGVGGMLHNASYTTGGGAGGPRSGAGGGYGSGQSAGPSGGYGGGTAYGGGNQMGPSPNAPGSGNTQSHPGDGTTATGTTNPGSTSSTTSSTAGGTASGDFQGQRVNQDVMKTRIEQANSEWMKDPKNQQKIFRTLQAEGGVGNIGANLEQMSNYAASRGKTLQQVVEARGKSQFYGPLRRFHGDPGSGAMKPHERDAYNSAWTPEKQAAWDKASKEVFSGGSNRINYATDQGTVGDPNYNPSKMTKVGNNMFGVQPGTEKWVGAQRGKAQVSGPVTVASTAPGGGTSGGVGTGTAVLPGTVAGGGASPGAKEKWEQQGIMTMEGKEYRYGSGGSGKGATPAGSYNINLDDRMGIAGPGGRGSIGPKGRGYGAIATVGGLNGEINRGRAGIQIHKAFTQRLNKLYTAGCFGIDPKQWPAYREHLIDMAKRNPGGLRLDVGEDGRAQVVLRGTPLPMPGAPAVAGAGEKSTISPATAAQAIPPPPTGTGTATAPDLPKTSEGGDKIGPLQPGPPKTSATEGGDKIESLKPGAPKSSSRDEQMNVNLKVNDAHVQFAKRSMRREADREVREARWNSYSDIGAA